MYTFLLVILYGLSLLLLLSGIRGKKRGRIVGGIALAALTFLFFEFLKFWGEALWFEAIGFQARFWKQVLVQAGSAVGVGILSALIVTILTLGIPKDKRAPRALARGIGAAIGVVWGYSNWDLILRFLNKVPAGISEPILEKDASFYLFSLPFYEAVLGLLFFLLAISILFSLALLYYRPGDEELAKIFAPLDDQKRRRLVRFLYANLGIVLILAASSQFFNRFQLLYSDWGAVNGPGWTDVHIRLPAYTIAIIVALVLAVIMLIPKTRAMVQKRTRQRISTEQQPPLFTVGAVVGVLLLSWFILLSVIPGLFQWLRVEPNEITFEQPYIEHNIELTRYGFKLHDVEERMFPAKEVFNREMVRNNQDLFNNVRLWDYRALDAVYKQFQEIRLYYEFVDVDVDRYHYNDQYRQVMVSAREMDSSNLPKQSQTFVNQRFKYTHGYGITLTPVSEFTSQGLPNLVVRDIPPKSKFPELNVERPEIYYGELTDSHIFANSSEKEFDYPSGENNVYSRYQGKGGVQMKNFFRKFLFGYKFNSTRFLLSGYPTLDTRIMFRRDIRRRLQTIAPFLKIDDDPYIVLADGELHWIVDCYTTSEYFPYSESFNRLEQLEYRQNQRVLQQMERTVPYLGNINYIRNSVKAVVNAYDGSVDLYVFDKDDVLIKVWQNIFPDMFKSRDEMPEALEKHVRYPADMLLVQGLVYAKYHMTDPTVFYNQEDLWVRATEKYYNNVQPVEPYYVMWEPPEKANAEFIIMMPFTPKNRQVMIGWIAGMCDPGNYGRFLAYKFPKEKRILGPQQVETKIDQDRFLAGQLSLWDQRGSSVIRGNVLAIPIDETLLYVEPIYLQAETAAYPELRLVAVMHGDNLSYAESFDKALEGLFTGAPPAEALPEEGVAAPAPVQELIQQANDAFERYLSATGSEQFDQAGAALQELRQALNDLQQAQANQPRAEGQ